MADAQNQITIECWHCHKQFKATINEGVGLASAIIYKGERDERRVSNPARKSIKRTCPYCGRENMVDIARREQ